jgi:large subunit ribosomal protein L23
MSKEHFYDVIRGPVISEKGTLVSSSNQVVFNVSRTATKPEIKKAVEGLFGVKVKAVNTLVRKGKMRRFRGRAALLSDVKKAYVTLEEGSRLDVTTGL